MNDKLLIVADLGLLKAYRFTMSPAGSPRLELLEEIVLDEARRRICERVSDLAGRRAAPTNKNWGAPMSNADNLKLEFKRRLVKRITKEIERLSQGHPDSGLWLAADREINSPITSLLPHHVRQRLETNLAADLVRATNKKVINSFAPHLAARKLTKRSAASSIRL